MRPPVSRCARSRSLRRSNAASSLASLAASPRHGVPAGQNGTTPTMRSCCSGTTRRKSTRTLIGFCMKWPPRWSCQSRSAATVGLSQSCSTMRASWATTRTPCAAVFSRPSRARSICENCAHKASQPLCAFSDFRRARQIAGSASRRARWLRGALSLGGGKRHQTSRNGLVHRPGRGAIRDVLLERTRQLPRLR